MQSAERGKRGTWAQSGTASREQWPHFSARLCWSRPPLRAGVAAAQYQCPAGCWQFPLPRGSGQSTGLRFPTLSRRSWSPASDVNHTVLYDNKANLSKGSPMKHSSLWSVCCVKLINIIINHLHLGQMLTYSKIRGVCKVMLTCQSFLTFIRPQQLLPCLATGGGAHRQRLNGVLSNPGLISLNRQMRGDNAFRLNSDGKYWKSV